MIRTYTKLVNYKEQKIICSFLSFNNLSAECFLTYLQAIYAFLNFDLLSLHSLNFPKISASFLIGPFFIIGDCVYLPNLRHLTLVALTYLITSGTPVFSDLPTDLIRSLIVKKKFQIKFGNSSHSSRLLVQKLVKSQTHFDRRSQY